MPWLDKDKDPILRAVQSDPSLCCKHPGEFVIFHVLFVVIN